MRNEPLPHPAVLAGIGALALAVGIGVGRFGFTAAAPAMARDGSLTQAACAATVAAHFAGYAVGALSLARLRREHVVPACVAGLAACVALAALASQSLGPWWMGADRFLAGVASGVVMVAASTWLFALVGTRWAPVLYGGVGLGVAVVSEMCCALAARGHGGTDAWTCLAGLAAVLAVPAAGWMLSTRDATPRPQAAPTPPDIGRRCLLGVYAVGGFGYVVSATYLPTVVRDGFPDMDPVHLFALFGLAALPSCWAWLRVDALFGTRRAMTANYLVQAVGTALPVLSHHPLALLGSSVLVGGTFMGVVALGMSAGRRHATPGSNLMAYLTAAYATGQFLGPLAAAAILSRGGTLDRPLLAASLSLLAGAAAAGLPREFPSMTSLGMPSLRALLAPATAGRRRHRY